MHTAIILIRTEAAQAADIGERLSHLPGVNRVLVVEGTHQLVAMVAAKSAEDLSALVDRHIAPSEGVEIAEVLHTRRQFTHHEFEDETVGFGP